MALTSESPPTRTLAPLPSSTMSQTHTETSATTEAVTTASVRPGVTENSLGGNSLFIYNGINKYHILFDKLQMKVFLCTGSYCLLNIYCIQFMFSFMSYEYWYIHSLTIYLNINRFNHKHYRVFYCKHLRCSEIRTVMFCKDKLLIGIVAINGSIHW